MVLTRRAAWFTDSFNPVLTGKLFTVEPESGVTREIDLGGGNVMSGDGILLRHRKLFVVQNFLNQIAVVKLERGLGAGEVVRHITNPNFDVPTTIAEFAGRLWAVNARFGVASPEQRATRWCRCAFAAMAGTPRTGTISKNTTATRTTTTSGVGRNRPASDLRAGPLPRSRLASTRGSG